MSSEKWETYSFSDFVAINPSVKLTGGGTFSFVEMKDLTDGQRSVYSSAERSIAGGARFQNNDTLFARITPCLENGKICQVKGLKNNIGFGSTEFLVFRGKEGISDNDFIFYLSRYEEVRRFAEQNMIGTSGRQRVSKEAFDNLIINLPPLPIQRRIASILTALDDKIELNRRMNETLEGIAQALWGEWFGKYVMGEELPEDAIKCTFEEHLDVDRGLSYKGEGLVGKDDEGVPMYNLNSVLEGGGFKYAGMKYYSGEYKERHLVNPGELIVTNTEQGHKYLLIGYPAVIPKMYGKGICSHHIYRVRVKPESFLTSQFFYYLMLHPMIREQIVACANGTTVNMLKIDGLKVPVFYLPPQKQVQDFSAMVQNIWDKQEENNQESRTLAAMRDALLSCLMRGEIEI